jgi:hypothetical protein
MIEVVVVQMGQGGREGGVRKSPARSSPTK